ncbi:hypothetical protein [Nostoc sp. MG11]|uniref:hypothetical protein n=1 Tax=Nostoc sp. MG11 TaxID=2721166 RepID=UPI001868C8C2|nr:hypothetical protein [Nostoc sp. MG11]
MPLDPEYPAESLNFMLTETQVKVLLTFKDGVAESRYEFISRRDAAESLSAGFRRTDATCFS